MLQIKTNILIYFKSESSHLIYPHFIYDQLISILTCSWPIGMPFDFFGDFFFYYMKFAMPFQSQADQPGLVDMNQV